MTNDNVHRNEFNEHGSGLTPPESQIGEYLDIDLTLYDGSDNELDVAASQDLIEHLRLRRDPSQAPAAAGDPLPVLFSALLADADRPSSVPMSDWAPWLQPGGAVAAHEGSWGQTPHALAGLPRRDEASAAHAAHAARPRRVRPGGRARRRGGERLWVKGAMVSGAVAASVLITGAVIALTTGQQPQRAAMPLESSITVGSNLQQAADSFNEAVVAAQQGNVAQARELLKEAEAGLPSGGTDTNQEQLHQAIDQLQAAVAPTSRSSVLTPVATVTPTVLVAPPEVKPTPPTPTGEPSATGTPSVSPTQVTPSITPPSETKTTSAGAGAGAGVSSSGVVTSGNS